MSDREMYYKIFCSLTRISVVICLIVVILGAFVRLSNAGLGCPDWPGCYGQLFSVPETATEISIAEQNYQRPVETDKAWKEMIHRYMAGILGLLIFTLTVIAVIHRRYPRQPVKLPLLISVLVIFQALLGMWTVTWLLAPIVVTTHLLGGMILLSLLWWLTLKTSLYAINWKPTPKMGFERGNSRDCSARRTNRFGWLGQRELRGFSLSRFSDLSSAMVANNGL